MIRTTVRLEDEIFKEARKKAIDERVAFANIVNQALKNYLQQPKQAKKQEFKFKVYNMGTIKGNLSRQELYENI